MKFILKITPAFLIAVLVMGCTEKEEATPAVEEPAKEEAAPTPVPEANSSGGDWSTWGRDGTNNMMTPATGLPTDITAGDTDGNTSEGAKHLKWVAELGSQAYGTATVKDGRVFIGTNNEKPRIEGVVGDRGIVMCFDEQTGDFLWQLSVPKLDAGKVSDWEFLGICSSVTVDGKHGYVVTNRCEIICLDVYGLSDGNDGPFEEEGKYKNAGLSGLARAESAELAENDGDIVWGFDMRELGVFPHNVASSSVVVTDKYVIATTSNGVDQSHLNVPSPEAPCLIVLDKATGELVAEENSIDGMEIMHCNWSSPAYVEDLAGVPTIVFGAGDGICYGFHAEEFAEVEDELGKLTVLKELWKVDCCPKEYRFNEDGEPIKYASYPGPSEIISSPVVYDDKVYVAIGQDPEHGEGVGAFTCIDPTKGTGQDAIVWQFREIKRSISTPSIVDGLIYISDYTGRVYCLDAATGEHYWTYDTLSHIWGSTFYVDGKVLIGTEDGELIYLKAGKDVAGEDKEDVEPIATVTYPAPIYATPVVANNTMYVMTQTHLYAYELSSE